MVKKGIAGGVVLIGLMIFGFVFLLRSCLSKYDERSGISKTLVFENQGQTIIFSLVKFDKTVSYSRNGGFVRKSVNTSYFAQINDAASGKKILEKKIKSHSQIKNYPVEIIGAIPQTAILFVGELILLNPFTLDIVANTKILEEKNPMLKGKFPLERKYFSLDPVLEKIQFTATDGTVYLLDPVSLQAKMETDSKPNDPRKQLVLLRREIESNREEIRSNYENFRIKNKGYSNKQLSADTYKKEVAVLDQERAILEKKRDSLRNLENLLEEDDYTSNTRKNKIESFNSFSVSYPSSLLNSDTFMGKWYGLFTTASVTVLGKNFNPTADYHETARNQLYIADLQTKPKGNSGESVVLSANKTLLHSNMYLAGGFLVDKKTANPIKLHNPDGYLILSKSQVGTAGTIILHRIDLKGNTLWQCPTLLQQFSDWVLTPNYLVVRGNYSKKPGTSPSVIFYAVSWSDGKNSVYDFNLDKVINN